VATTTPLTEGRGHAHTTIKQITRRGGVVGNDNDDDDGNGHDGDDDNNVDGGATRTPLTIESTINKRREVEGQGGNYWKMTRRGTRTCTHNNQTDHAEGGVVGNGDDDGDGGATATTAMTTMTTMADAVGGKATTG
jgi:hypothetical protein